MFIWKPGLSMSAAPPSDASFARFVLLMADETPRLLSFPYQSLFFFFWSTWLYLGTSEDHNTGVSLCRRVKGNRYLYFLHPPSIQLLSLHRGICRGSSPLLLETTATVSVFSLSFKLLPPSPFPMSSSSPLCVISRSGYHSLSWSLHPQMFPPFSPLSFHLVLL